MIDRLKRLVGAGTIAALAWAGLAVAQQDLPTETRVPAARPKSGQRAYRIIIDTIDDEEVADVRQVGYLQPLNKAPAAPTASTPSIPATPQPVSTSNQGVIVTTVDTSGGNASSNDCCACKKCQLFKGHKSKGACDCEKCKTSNECDCGSKSSHGLKFRIGKKSTDCECASCNGCSTCGKKTKSVVLQEVPCETAAPAQPAPDCDACGRCGSKLFGHLKCTSCGKHNLLHHSKCNECESGDCAAKEPHHFSSGHNDKHGECCTPNGSICDNVCNDKGCQREPCPCPSNEVLTYYRCGHYGHYPTFWRSWPTGWLAHRPPITDTMYDRYRKPPKGSSAMDSPSEDDRPAPESDPDLLNKMRSRQNRTSPLGEQVPENMQPRRRTVPERIPDSDVPPLPGKSAPSAPKAEKKEGSSGSYRWNRSQQSDPGLGQNRANGGNIQRTTYVIVQDDE